MRRLRIEHDAEVNALYIYLQEIPAGGVARTIELEDGVNLDVDEEGNTIGLEFVEADEFYRVIDRNGGELDIPLSVEEARDFALA
jgi:uncharacterized protein YuzE